MLCDDGNIKGCLLVGLAFAGISAAGSIATVGLAYLALTRPSKASRVFLVVYSMLPIAYCVTMWNYDPGDFAWYIFLIVLAGFGVFTLICTVFFGAGKNRIPQQDRTTEPVRFG
jgi:hypothetical protein